MMQPMRRAALLVGTAVAVLVGCTSGGAETAGRGDTTITTAPFDGTTALPAEPGTAPGTTETTTTTTEAPTTAPPTTPPPPTTKPPRPAPPKPGRAQPPEALTLPGPPVVDGEGVWQPLGTAVGGAPAMYSTLIRANLDGSALAAVVWIDQTAVRAQLFPGTREPAGAGYTTPSAIPSDQQSQLLAAFNSGFLLKESQGGFYLEGRDAVPLHNGNAAAHIDTDGNLTVGMLGRDFDVGPNTAAIRQNLPLIVDAGVAAATTSDGDNRVWGATLGHTPFVWRSALAVRADGSLLYVAGPGLSSRMLANVLVSAGAIRAMELDINPSWVTFNVYAFDPRRGTVSANKLLPAMTKPATRYLTPDDRDFFALFARP